MRLIAHSDGHYLPRAVDELVPGFAAERDDVVVGFEDSVRQPIVAEELPDVLDRPGYFRLRRIAVFTASTDSSPHPAPKRAHASVATYTSLH